MKKAYVFPGQGAQFVGMGRMAGKLDMALQYYYWAYSLIRSVQHPNEVKDESGKTLMTVIPVKIREILQGLPYHLPSESLSRHMREPCSAATHPMYIS